MRLVLHETAHCSHLADTGATNIRIVCHKDFWETVTDTPAQNPIEEMSRAISGIVGEMIVAMKQTRHVRDDLMPRALATLWKQNRDAFLSLKGAEHDAGEVRRLMIEYPDIDMPEIISDLTYVIAEFWGEDLGQQALQNIKLLMDDLKPGEAVDIIQIHGQQVH